MSEVLAHLNPRDVFYYFELISSIPRGSGNEKAISDFMIKFAKDLGLWSMQDEMNNVYIKKPASPGYEHCPPVIIQGHLDMVCEKNSDVDHDFSSEGLKLVIEGDYIKAKGTTLGADDGVALAYQMAILADQSLKHPPLEIVMTTDEERGMTGAEHLHPEYLEGKMVINLDTETEGEFLVSNAGGIRANLELGLEYVPLEKNQLCYQIKVSQLLGGHSGADIHLERANAHILMGRILSALRKKIAFSIVHFTGGSKDNVITRECTATIVCTKQDVSVLLDVVAQMQVLFKKEYEFTDPDINVEAIPAENKDQSLSESITNKIIDILMLIPNGVIGYSHSIENLVETSLNLGIVQMDHNKMIFSSAIRSSMPSKKYELVDKLNILADSVGAQFSTRADYPAWTYQKDSRLREICIDLYKKMYGKEPKVTAIHAGLECGYIAKKIKGADIIAFGPDVLNIHSPEEKVSISSMARVYEYLKVLLENLK